MWLKETTKETETRLKKEREEGYTTQYHLFGNKKPKTNEKSK